MSLTVGLCKEGNKKWPYTRVEYTMCTKIAAAADSLVVAALLVIGTLAIIGSGVSYGNSLYALGTIGALGGGWMIAGAVLIACVDSCTHWVCTAEGDKDFQERTRRKAAIDEKAYQRAFRA
jgi:hypothetical protein